MFGLTPTQLRAKQVIAGHIAQYGDSPSLQDLAQLLGKRSKGDAHRIVAVLEERGHVIVDRDGPTKARIYPVFHVRENQA